MLTNCSKIPQNGIKVCSVVVKLLLRADKTAMMKSQTSFNGLLLRRNLKLVNK
jgi:hypothetical protein